MYLVQARSGAAKKKDYGLSQPGAWQKSAIACSFFVNISMYVLIARSLGLQTFGSYLFLQWLATVAIPVIGAGMSTLNSRQIADVQSREAPRLIAGTFYFLWYHQHRRILLYSLVYLLLALPLAQLFHIFTPVRLLLASLSSLPLLLSNVAGTTLRSLRRSDLLAMLQLFGALLTLLLMMIAAQIEGRPIEAFLLAFALANTLTLIVAVLCVMRLLPLENALQPGIFLRERLMENLKPDCLPFLIDVIIWKRSELLLLACWCKQEELGCYILSTMICSGAMGLIPGIFSQGLHALLLRMIPGLSYRSHYDIFVKTSCYMVFLAVLSCALASMLSPTIIYYSLGAVYLPLVRPLRIQLIASVFGSIATISLTHLIHQRSPERQQWSGISIAIIKIVLMIPLIVMWGVVGAALASMLTQSISALLSIYQCKRLLASNEKSLMKG